MTDASPAVGQQAAELNVKAQADNQQALFALNLQAVADNQQNARLSNALNFIAGLATVTSNQTGQTENQQTVSPGRTGTPESTIDSVGVSAATVAAVNPALGVALVQAVNNLQSLVADLVSVNTTAAGGASTPSQTTPKTTSTTSA